MIALTYLAPQRSEGTTSWLPAVSRPRPSSRVASRISNVLNHPDRVADATRTRVERAVNDLGFVRGGVVAEHAAHWRRNGFGTWLFTPAVSGWYPKKAPQEARPVPLLGEPWPGVPVRGRGAGNRADACWLPIAKGLTPHGLRHTHRTVMDRYREGPHGPAHGPYRRLRICALRPRHSGHAKAAHARPVRTVGGSSRLAAGHVSYVIGARAPRPSVRTQAST
ncbi:hypothetical protein SGR_3363 [Streptomyces griseus subsp. griseus NBRC 13350]|uniref:Uncharacterized protein n=1 Tax=Streptomyces griseus subsp. griseus (strain JCM 4626 / CBS 651.72 / NBRC 13350 / KCC S-0626 / ISP 5235) TaxID=455632 RepID=B1VM82_STRGG|nr:hypothetical protein SGR_3363 [Streptomyces griseus subsp. griseus NBRC 13350]